MTGPVLAAVLSILPAQETLPGDWYDDNLQAAFDEARKDRKPVVVVFRCPP